ncbi:MAG: hypothetical protein ACXVIJ_02790 [Thermoanaerobaculia bacterium]
MPTTSLRFGSYRELAAGIAQRLLASRGSDPLAPLPEEVIVASAGLAQAIDRNRVAAGASPAAVRTANRTIESFAAAVVNAAGEFPRVANDAERRLAMRTAARAIPDPLMETRGTAAMLERTYRDVRDSGLTLRDFAKRLSSAAVQNRERARTLVRTWEEYERLIAKLGCIDPADLLARATGLIRSGAAVSPQILAGFYDMTGAQLAVVDALRAVEKLAAAFIPVDPDDVRACAFAKPFIQHFTADASLVPRPASLDIRQPQWTIHEHETREEEVRAVCRAVRASLDGGVPATDIGIVARSLEPYDIHLFERFARENGFTTTAEATMPLIAHRIGRAVAMLLRIRERDFPRSEVLEIVRGGLKVKTRINVDNADAETRAAGIAGGTASLLRSRAARSLVVGDYIDLVAELEELTGRIDGNLIARLADSFRIDTETDLAACSALDNIADLFIRAEKWNRPADASSILDALEQVEIRQPATGDRQPIVWLGDVMRFRGRSFAHLFAVRLQDGVVPQRRNEDPLLLDSDRHLTGVREIGNGRDEEQLLFQLIRSGSSAHVAYSYASSDGFGRPLRPSHYLKAFALEQRPEEKKEILRNFSRWTGGAPPHSSDRCSFSPALVTNPRSMVTSPAPSSSRARAAHSNPSLPPSSRTLANVRRSS